MRMYLKVLNEGAVEPMLVDVTVFDIGYEVNKMVFEQTNIKTGKTAWVVFPKEYYEDQLDILKDALEAEIKKAKADQNYLQDEYRKIIESTSKKMVFQDRSTGNRC